MRTSLIIDGDGSGAEDALRRVTAANDQADAAARRHAFGVRNLGQQFGDMGAMVSAGTPPLRAISVQLGQVGYAMSEMQGRAGRVGAFLTGPWGIALTVAVGVLLPMVDKLFEGGKASDELADRLGDAAQAADSFGTAQGMLGKVIDLTTGKLKTQNQVLIETIRLQAQVALTKANDRLREETEAKSASGRASSAGAAGMYGSSGGNLDAAVAGKVARERQQAGLDAALGRLKGVLGNDGLAQADPQAYGRAVGVAVGAAIKDIDRLAVAGEVAGKKIADVKLRILDLGTIGTDKAAALESLSVMAGGPVPADLKPYARDRKPRAPKKPVDQSEWGRDAADRVAGIISQFDDTPQMVRQVEQAGRQLADILDDANKRKPKNLDELIASIRQAQGVIQDGLNAPFDDFLKGQREQLEIGALINAGHVAEAEALRAIYQIEAKRGPLSAEQRAQILASTVALHDQERALERIRSVQQANLQALSDMQGIITQSIYEGPGSLADLPGRLLDSFKRFQAELISEQVFGEMFRDLRDQVLGASKVDVATSKIVTGFDRAATAANALAGALSGAAAPGAGVPGEPAAGQDEGDIVVTARRTSDIYGEAIAKGLGRVGLGQDAADKIGRYAGRGLAGAFEGQMASGVAGMLGIKLNGTGSSIGGAIGGLTGIPGAGAAGGILGGLVGNLLTSPKTGSATIGAAGGEAVVTGTGGNSAALRREASGLAAQVNGSIQQIVDQLGGELGSFAVSVGQRGDKYVVDTRGQGRTKYGKANDGIVAYDTAEEAQSAALRDAVADGAIAGLSAAVERALRSSADVEVGLKRALKVQEVELLVGGIGATMAKSFADLERQAAARVSIAREYGFDVLAIEKKNAEDRTALAEQLLKSQVGSLQSLVDEMTAGSLFEGTAIDRIGALDQAITKAKADLDAGKDGAADTLAGLFEQRLSASKEAYATTGRFAADRGEVLNSAQAAIARANAQIAAAQGKSDPALATTNASLDENNDQNARLLAEQQRTNTLLAQLISSGKATGFDLSALAAV